MRRLCLVACVVLGVMACAGEASAQGCTTASPGASWVCVNGGWLPPGHPGIPVCTPPPNPYTNPDEAAWCAANAPAPTHIPTVFQVGQRYYYGYPSAGIFLCIGVAIGIDGVPVATLQYVQNYPSRHGEVMAIRQDRAGTWSRIP